MIGRFVWLVISSPCVVEGFSGRAP